MVMPTQIQIYSRKALLDIGVAVVQQEVEILVILVYSYEVIFLTAASHLPQKAKIDQYQKEVHYCGRV